MVAWMPAACTSAHVMMPSGSAPTMPPHTPRTRTVNTANGRSASSSGRKAIPEV